MPIRLIVADSHPVVCTGLTSFFADADVQIVGETHTGELTVSRTLERLPDVLLLEIDFPDMSGFDVVERLRARGYSKRIVFFSASDRLFHLSRAVAVGADSYLSKRATQTELLNVITALANQTPSRRVRGVSDASERIEAFGAYSGELRRAVPLLRRRPVDPLNPLTERETQVLRHIATGLSNKEIASSLQLSLDTVKEHVQNILRKLDVDDRTQAAVWAVRNKLIP